MTWLVTLEESAVAAGGVSGAASFSQPAPRNSAVIEIVKTDSNFFMAIDFDLKAAGGCSQGFLIETILSLHPHLTQTKTGQDCE